MVGSFWLLPALLVGMTMVLSWALLRLDLFYSFRIEHSFFALFGGQADAARQLLATIAGSLITVISISFSITILALQQVATQYSPRVLRNFTGDRVNQVVLGSYLATFVYALLTLRTVRADSADSGAFVPALSITFGLVLTLLCIGLLILFISHISSTLQVENIVRRIHGELMGQLDNLFPEQIGESAPDLRTPQDVFAELVDGLEAFAVPCDATGFVQALDYAPLSRTEASAIRAVFIRPRVGDFVIEGEPVITVCASTAPDADQHRLLLKAMVVGGQRSIYQDPLFAIEQLVDIALRALSSGINDPATAANVLFQLTHSLCRLSVRGFPPVVRVFEGNTILFVFNAPPWEHYVMAAYSHIRRAARGQIGLLEVLIRQLQRLATLAPTPDRKEPVIQQLVEVKQQVIADSLHPADRERLLHLIDRALFDIGP